MHATIAEFPSQSLYNSSLISHQSVATHLLRDLPGVSGNLDTISDVLEVPLVFFDTAGCEYFERLQDDTDEGGRRSIQDEGSRCNENEAMIVKTWVEKLASPATRLVNPSNALNLSSRAGSRGTLSLADSRHHSVSVASSCLTSI